MNPILVGRVWRSIPIALLAVTGWLCLAPDGIAAASLFVQSIHDFPASGSEPSHSTSGLVLVADGNFYGSAGGGATSSGTIYRMTPAGLVTSLFSFRYTNSAYPDGYSPGGLGIGKDGAIHGTTTAGGANWNPTYRVELLSL